MIRHVTFGYLISMMSSCLVFYARCGSSHVGSKSWHFHRPSVSAAMFQALVVALVHSIIQCWLVSLPICNVCNAIFGRAQYNRLRFRDHITNALICLHWLRVRQRIEFKLAV